MSTHIQRHLFHAGRLVPKRQRREPRPCHGDWHAGPHINTEVYEAYVATHSESAIDWSGVGECAACMSTVHKSQIRPRAAA